MSARQIKIGLVGVFVVSTLVWAVAAPAPEVSAQVAPEPNPEIDDSCGIDVTLVLDASGSIQSANSVEDVRGAAMAFLDSLRNTDSTARITQFASLSEELAPATLITNESLAVNGPHGEALTDYYNPRPQRPNDVDIYRYDGRGDPTSANNWDKRNGNDQYTNWDQGLRDAGTTPAELMIYITDGEPTGYDLDQPGDPFDQGPPPDVGINTNKDQADQVMLDRSIDEANTVKVGGTRMLAVGVGNSTGDTTLQNRLKAISGPQLVRDADLGNVDSLNEIDVAIVTDFANLAAFLRSVVLELCSPSLTITKRAQTAGDATYRPAPGWAITVTPTVPNGGMPPFEWVLPNTTPAASKTLDTNANGNAQFQWEPKPPEEDSEAVVEEALQPGYIAGRPGDRDYRCELRDEFGQVRTQAGELDLSDPTRPAFQLTDQGAVDPPNPVGPIGQEVVTCTIWNSFDYQPAIELTKVNTPTEVRGDLTPPAEVVSAYEVTNPGNTPLSGVSVTDDRCGLVQPVPPTGTNTGDTNGDGLLDPGEAWQFTCTRAISTPASADPAGQTIVNNATASGTDPTGTVVTDDATDDVVAYNPAIELTKLVSAVGDPDQTDQNEVTVGTGDPVRYTYAVRNAGNTPLEPVTLTDDTPPCDTGITRLADTVGNDDDTLDVGEEWAYECDANPTSTVINTAIVTGLPLNPVTDQPFPDPNPEVTDTDTAKVNLVNPDIELTKLATPDLLLLNENGDPEPVTYTFQAENTGDVALTRPPDNPGSTTDDNWVVDPNCSPVEFVDDNGAGNGNGDDVLDPGEIWNFTCGPVGIARRTVNTATIVAASEGGNVSDTASEVVDVLIPGIDVTKTALRSPVLDPDAQPELGPDTPDPRPAEYTYEVRNTGNVDLDLIPDPPVDDICARLLYGNGDDGDGLLNVGEVWVYSCSDTLEREQANAPPITGAESGIVRNTVTATGIPQGPQGPEPNKSVTATATAGVMVIEPGLTITKTASADAVLVGEEVTYTFVVANTGDVGLPLIGPGDDRCAPLVLQGGDTNGNGILDGANGGNPESWTWTCTRAIGLPEPPAASDENLVIVFGIDPLGNTYAAVDTAEVRVFDPDIDLVKTVSETLVPVGTEVTYGFEVTNTGRSPLPADDVLALVVLGDISDPIQPTCLQPKFTGGDDNGNQLLDREPAEVWTYTCAATIDQPTTNVAAVEGIGGTTFNPPIPVRVADYDAQFVQTFDPGIDIVKSADPTELLGGGPVTYTYEVTNTGDVPLADVVARITDDTCARVTYVSGDIDDDDLLDTPNSIFEDSLDETWIFTCTTDIAQTTTNTVVVVGTPTDSGGTDLCGEAAGDGRLVDQLCDVNAQDRETVVVTNPGTIVVKKVVHPEGSDETFDFSLTDNNDFSLGGGEAATFAPLPPGDYTLDEVVPDGWELYDLTCDDPSGDTVVTLDAGRAEIPLAEGETVTCTYTNIKLSAIVVEKETDPADTDDTFSFTATGTDGFELGAGGQEVIADLRPGDYTVTEVLTDDWELTDLVCVDPTGDTTIDLAGGEASVALGLDEIVTCTYTNTQRGSIVITKQAEPSSTGQAFEFDVDGKAVTLGAGESETLIDLVPGEHTITETLPAGWSLVGLECNDPSGNSTTDRGAATATVTLDGLETVECTFSNVQGKLPSTGSNATRTLLLAAAVALLAGLVLWGSTRRRRPA